MEKAWSFETEFEIAISIAKQEKRFRKVKGITQVELSRMSGVPLATIRLFEQQGKISLLAFIRIAQALGNSLQIKQIFSNVPYESIEEVVKDGRMR